MASTEPTSAPPPALRALVACIREAPPDELRRHIESAVDVGNDLCSFAAQHHLLPLLCVSIREADLQCVLGERHWQRISQEHAVLVHHQAHMFAAALEVLETLRAAGVAPVLPIKGLALACLIWPELLPRRLIDIDLLVARSQVGRAQKALRTAGFAPYTEAVEPYLLHFHAPTLRRAGVRVELHHGLWESGGLPFRTPDLDGLAARSLPRTVQDQPICGPCPEDVLIMMVAVLARDRFDVRLHQWGDLYWLLTRNQSGLDPERLHSLARALGMRRLVDVVLRFAQELFECGPLLDSEWDSLCADAYDRLRPVLWRRLVAGSRSAGRHAIPFNWIASRREGKARPADDPPGDAAPKLPQSSSGLWLRLRGFGGPVAVAAKTAGYCGRLLTSRLWRQELREEIAVRRVLAALSEAEPTEADAGH